MHWKNSTRLGLRCLTKSIETIMKEVSAVVIPCVFIFLCLDRDFTFDKMFGDGH